MEGSTRAVDRSAAGQIENDEAPFVSADMSSLDLRREAEA
jgi:hypothetical protein